MTTKTTFRSRVMKYSWNLYHTTSKTWKECMVMAWRLVKLIRDMRNGCVRFRYKKVGGSVRDAFGTLSNIKNYSLSKSKENFGTIRYFDIEKNAFRSFRIENLYSIGAKSV